MTTINKLLLDSSSNEELKNFLANKNPGQSFEITLEVQLDENTGQQASFTVLEVEVDDADEFVEEKSTTSLAEAETDTEAEAEGSEYAAANTVDEAIEVAPGAAAMAMFGSA